MSPNYGDRWTPMITTVVARRRFNILLDASNTETCVCNFAADCEKV